MEFAIAFPLLILLLMAIIEFGRLAFTYSEVWSAAREGARFATTVGDNDGNGLPNFIDCPQILGAAQSKVTFHPLTASDIEVIYEDQASPPNTIASCQTPPAPPAKTPPNPVDAGNIDPGTQIKVVVHSTYDSIVPLVGVFLDGLSLDSTQIRSVHYEVKNGS